MGLSRHGEAALQPLYWDIWGLNSTSGKKAKNISMSPGTIALTPCQQPKKRKNVQTLSGLSRLTKLVVCLHTMIHCSREAYKWQMRELDLSLNDVPPTPGSDIITFTLIAKTPKWNLSHFNKNHQKYIC